MIHKRSRKLLPSGLIIFLRNISFSNSRDSCNYMVLEFLETVWMIMLDRIRPVSFKEGL